MKRSANKIIAIAAIGFSVLTFVEGSRVLLGLSTTDYIVFQPLLIYNVIMGAIGIYVGIEIFRFHKSSLRNSTIITYFHIITLITISFIYYNYSLVSLHSLNAMIIRSVFWLIITITLWISIKYIKNKKEK